MTDRPNFPFFITDQQRADWLGCYGHPVLKTPNIDAIAANKTIAGGVNRNFELLGQTIMEQLEPLAPEFDANLTVEVNGPVVAGGYLEFEFNIVGNLGDDSEIDEVWITLHKPLPRGTPAYLSPCPDTGAAKLG